MPPPPPHIQTLEMLRILILSDPVFGYIMIATRETPRKDDEEDKKEEVENIPVDHSSLYVCYGLYSTEQAAVLTL